MSANYYSVESLLVGKAYRSKTLEGIIEYAEKRDDVWYENAYAYVVAIRPTKSIDRVYRTIAVATQD